MTAIGETAFLAMMGVVLLLLLAVQAQLVWDVVYSLTGFAIGFIGAVVLYRGRKGRD